MARFPEDVCINAERWALIRSTSRLAVEMDLIETWCPALRPTYFRAPNNDDRIDEIEAYKVTEEEVEYLLDGRLDDKMSDYVNDCVCEEINSRAVGFTEWTVLRDRVKELEDRLNKPSLGARVLRWLREGPSIKEVATSWYAGIRRGS